MKKLAAVLSLALLLAGCAAGKDAAYTRIPMEQAVVRMEQESDYVLLDVRRPDEFRAGHIPGAVCVPNETIGTAEIPELPDKDQLIFIYCRSGNRSRQAASKLAEMGYTNLVEIGGIMDYPLETVSE